MGKYSLIFEPKYVTNQYAVSFDNVGNSSIIEVHKYSDIPRGSGVKLKKNSLLEIDRITAACPDLHSFFNQNVPSNLFMYCGNNLHKMFIGYMYNKHMYTIPYIINNPEFLKKLQYVTTDGVKVTDIAGITSYINFIAEDKDNKFYRFILGEKQAKTTGLSSSTIQLINLYKNADRSCDYSEKEILRRDLETRLRTYKEYREMFLLHHHYQDKLEADKRRLEQLRSEVTSVVAPRVKPAPFEVSYTECEQLSLFDDEPKQKRITREGH